MPVISAFEQVAPAIKAIIDTEFAAEGIVATYDELHESLGKAAPPVAGISPIRDLARTTNQTIQETWVEVKVYNTWDPQINPFQAVNPAIITNWAERFRHALGVQQATFPGTGASWFFDVTNIEYPKDPTGNKTRFVATIRSLGDNHGLNETR